MSTLLELAERCEKAKGPDRELDDAIATALFTEKHRTCIKGLSDEAGGMWMYRYPDGSIGSSLRFTGSLDAAMTLVPEGRRIQLNIYEDGRGAVWLTPSRVEEMASICATPTLALCAAALRARAAEPEGNHP